MNFDRKDSAWNEKSPAQTSLFRSCWEIWIKEQPVTYLYPVSMILIKTLWRSGGLPVLMESKVSSSFLYMIARNQLLHNVAILRESGFNFKLFYGQRWCSRMCPEKFWWIEEYSSFRILQLGLKSNWQYDFLLFSLVCQLHLNIFIPREMESFIFTARKRSLRRLCFHRCLSFNRGVCPIACWDTDPPWDQRQTPPWQTPPSDQRQTPPGQTSPRQTPLGRHPLGRPPCAVHAGIRSISGWYASHWNAFLCLALCVSIPEQHNHYGVKHFLNFESLILRWISGNM